MHVVLSAGTPVRWIVLVLFAALWGASAAAGISVSPHWVNTNAHGATTVLLTFGRVKGYTPGEAVWCGEIMSAAPAIGSKPVPGTIFGSLPSRYDHASFSGNGAFTDIMSIPPSVVRRAYQAAAAGAPSTFFYVRRFINTMGGADEYVAVTCEMGSGGARTPFALLDVQMMFDEHGPLVTVRSGAHPPAISAALQYNGTGALRGRWEIVRPGDPVPEEHDLLTEGALPIEQRGTQRHYAEIDRFSVFLPPTGSYVLRGPDPSLLPTDVNGSYMILLRIEASPDLESVSALPDVGAGPAAVASGGLAGFPIPILRYYVTGTRPEDRERIELLGPGDLAEVEPARSVPLLWTGGRGGMLSRVVVIDPGNTILVTALLPPEADSYLLPPWVWTRTEAKNISWSVESLDADGVTITKSEWRTLFRKGENSGR